MNESIAFNCRKLKRSDVIHTYYTRKGIAFFADDTSLFLTVYDPNISADQLDKDLK